MAAHLAKLASPLPLAALRERLAELEHRGSSGVPIPTGWTEIDRAFSSGGLVRGALHEWTGIKSVQPTSRWSPPLSVLVHLAAQATAAAARESASLHVCWIGRRLWPSAPSLTATGSGLLSRSLFIDAADAPARLWAADLAARSSSILPIVDGTGFDMAASRRLQLAAEAGGWLVHLARPPGEAGELSAAATRWLIARQPSPGDEPRFALRLLRSKGLRSMTPLDRMFTLQRSERDRLVAVSAGVSDRSDAPALEARRSAPDHPRARRASA